MESKDTEAVGDTKLMQRSSLQTYPSVLQALQHNILQSLYTTLDLLCGVRLL